MKVTGCSKSNSILAVFFDDRLFSEKGCYSMRRQQKSGSNRENKTNFGKFCTQNTNFGNFRQKFRNKVLTKVVKMRSFGEKLSKINCESLKNEGH